MTTLSRRAVLSAALGGGGALLAGASLAGCQSEPEEATRKVSQWAGQRALIGHRGSSDVFPENSMVGFKALGEAGATAMEVSVRRTSDGQLIVMHDDSYDGTTTGKGKVADQAYSYTQSITLKAHEVGPGWDGQAVPTLSEVLETFGGDIILAIEAKDDECYPDIQKAIAEAKLQQSVMIKAHFSSGRIDEAQRAGYRVFAYFGSAQETTAENLSKVAAKLRPGTDLLVLWAYQDDGGYLDDALISQAVRSGIETWMASTHRRCDVAHYAALGVRGHVTPNYEYLATTDAAGTRDQWKTKKIAPGELTYNPTSDGYTPQWSGQDVRTFSTFNRPSRYQFICCGDLCPITADEYTIDLDLKWNELPENLDEHFDIVFGRKDDSYYEHQLAQGSGYHAILRASGKLGLFAHRNGVKSGIELASGFGPKLKADSWLKLQVRVTPEAVSVSRTDFEKPLVITAKNSDFRGGYLHIGRASRTGVTSVRSLIVSP